MLTPCVLGSSYSWSPRRRIPRGCRPYAAAGGHQEPRRKTASSNMISIPICSIRRRILFRKRWTLLACTLRLRLDQWQWQRRARARSSTGQRHCGRERDRFRIFQQRNEAHYQPRRPRRRRRTPPNSFPMRIVVDGRRNKAGSQSIKRVRAQEETS
jgi:hypothetical protein